MHPETESKPVPDWSYSRRVAARGIFNPRTPLIRTSWFWLVIVAPALAFTLIVVSSQFEPRERERAYLPISALFVAIWVNYLVTVLRARLAPLERNSPMMSGFLISTRFATDEAYYAGRSFDVTHDDVPIDEVARFIVFDHAKTSETVAGIDPSTAKWNRCPSDHLATVPGLATLLTAAEKVEDGSTVILTVAASALPHELPRIAYLAGRSLGRLEGEAYTRARGEAG